MTKRRLTIRYLSKNMLDLLHDCDCGESGSCLPNSRQWLRAALKRECDLTVTLREAISWIEDQEPQIVEAARQKFNVEQKEDGK